MKKDSINHREFESYFGLLAVQYGWDKANEMVFGNQQQDVASDQDGGDITLHTKDGRSFVLMCEVISGMAGEPMILLFIEIEGQKEYNIIKAIGDALTEQSELDLLCAYEDVSSANNDSAISWVE